MTSTLPSFPRSPSPARGERDFFCRAYDACLDVACASRWDTFSCDVCPSKGRHRLAPGQIVGRQEALEAITKAASLTLQTEAEARARADRLAFVRARREKQLESARRARIRSVEAGAVATRLRHAAREAELALVDGEQVSVDGLRIYVGGAVTAGVWRLVEIGLAQAAIDGLRIVILDGTQVRHVEVPTIALQRATSYAALFARRAGGLLLHTWPAMMVRALEACAGGPELVRHCADASRRFGAPALRPADAPVVDAPRGLQLEIPVGG